MSFPFIADAYFKTFEEITPSYLKKRKIQGLLVDLDNTLAPYDVPLPPEKVVSWVEALRKEGIRIVILSNNHEERVAKFSKDLPIGWISKSGKPHDFAYENGCRKLGLPRENVACVGDQIYIDTLGARKAGMKIFYVKPIRLRNYPLKALRHAAEMPFVWLTPRAKREEE